MGVSRRGHMFDFRPVRRILLATLTVLLLTEPFALQAERRGAILRLDLLDGRQLQGELLAVKGERLILRGSGGAGEEIDIRDIVRLRIGRRHAVGRGVVTGTVAGFVAGSITYVVLTDEHFRSEWGLLGVLLHGGCGAGIGGAIGVGAGFATRGREEVYPREKSELWVVGMLKRLRRLARFRDEMPAAGPADRT